MPVELLINDKKINAPLIKGLAVFFAALFLFVLLSIIGFSVLAALALATIACILLWLALPFIVITGLFQKS